MNLNSWILSKCLALPYPGVTALPVPKLSIIETLNILRRHLEKRFILFVFGQLSIYSKTLPKDRVSRVLFCYLGADSMGDALMDLAGRALLREVPIPVDLLVPASISYLFSEDPHFNQVYVNPNEVDFSRYEFLILNNLSLRSIKFKIKWARRLPFACFEGFRERLDFHHTELSFSALNKIFGLGLPENEISLRTRVTLSCNPQRYEKYLDEFKEHTGVLTVAVGGKEADRIYQHWVAFFILTDSDPAFWGKKFILLGSENGLEAAKEILSQSYANIFVTSMVGKTNLFQTQALIQTSCLFIGADGGLMHVAHSTKTPTMTLFPSRVLPDLRITQNVDSLRMHSQSDVNAISPQEIVNQLKIKVNALTL